MVRKITFWPSNLTLFGMLFVASPPAHPTCSASSNVKFLVGSVAAQPTCSPDVFASPPPHPIEFEKLVGSVAAQPTF